MKNEEKSEQTERSEWPELYTVKSSRFTLSPALFASWLQYLLFTKKKETATIDLDAPDLDELARAMQAQIRNGDDDG